MKKGKIFATLISISSLILLAIFFNAGRRTTNYSRQKVISSKSKSNQFNYKFKNKLTYSGKRLKNFLNSKRNGSRVRLNGRLVQLSLQEIALMIVRDEMTLDEAKLMIKIPQNAELEISSYLEKDFTNDLISNFEDQLNFGLAINQFGDMQENNFSAPAVMDMIQDMMDFTFENSAVGFVELVMALFGTFGSGGYDMDTANKLTASEGGSGIFNSLSGNIGFSLNNGHGSDEYLKKNPGADTNGDGEVSSKEMMDHEKKKKEKRNANGGSGIIMPPIEPGPYYAQALSNNITNLISISNAILSSSNLSNATIENTINLKTSLMKIQVQMYDMGVAR